MLSSSVKPAKRIRVFPAGIVLFKSFSINWKDFRTGKVMNTRDFEVRGIVSTRSSIEFIDSIDGSSIAVCNRIHLQPSVSHFWKSHRSRPVFEA